MYSEGVRFSDTFTLIIRYCLLQIAPMTTNLRVTAQIIFNKSVSGVIKRLFFLGNLTMEYLLLSSID